MSTDTTATESTGGGPQRPDPARIDTSRRALSPRNLVATVLGGYLPLLLTVLVVFLPLLWMALSSFKLPSEITTLEPKLLPQQPTLHNYREVLDRVPLVLFFRNSLIVTVVASVVKVTLALMSAYALVFVRFPFKNALFIIILVALMVPPQVSMLPNYLTISALGGRNTLWGIILPGLGTAFGTFLLRQQFKTLPPSLLEAAEMDGAGHWRRLWQIVMPVSAPTVATVALVTIVTEWNDYLWPLVITDRPETMTLPVGLSLLQTMETNTGAYGILMAGAVMVIVPVLIVFAALQRYIVAGLTQGSVTG